jgi:hypothetical protein
METLQNWGTEFVLATLKELQLAHWMFFHLFTLCSACAVIVLNDSQCERNRDLSDFERGQINGAHLDGASDKNSTIIMYIKSESF